MNPYDLHIAFVKWGSDGKSRPVVVLSLTSEIVTVLSITSQYESKSETIRAKYLPIMDWQQAGLHKQSYIDIASRNVLPITLLHSPRIGKLSQRDILSLIEALEAIKP
ncbi:MAG: hypothetical protein FWG36_09815 [Oscillospiraceae bacterium]|nr:hypothetical protein [Oscillospiraceae bacterium]